MSIVLIALLFAGDVATSATTATTTTTAAQPVEEKKICKREMKSESRMGSKRICLTAEEWKARQNGDPQVTRGLRGTGD